MATLYQLTNEYQYIIDLMTEEDADEELIAGTLEAIKGNIEVKADGYAAVMRQLSGEVKMLDEEKDFIDRAIKIRKANIERMNYAIAEAMNVLGVTEIKGEKHSFKLVGNGGLQPMKVDSKNVPDNYTRVIVEPDKEKIRKDLEDGINLAFAHLEPRGKHITIK